MHEVEASDGEAHRDCLGNIDRVLFELVGRLRVTLENGLKRSSTLQLSEFNVLHYLALEADGSLRLGNLARKLSFSPSRLSYQVRTLEKRGMLTRHPSQEDGRGAYATITETGREAHAEAMTIYRAIIGRVICAGLDVDEAQALSRTLSRLNDGIAIDY